MKLNGKEQAAPLFHNYDEIVPREDPSAATETELAPIEAHGISSISESRWSGLDSDGARYVFEFKSSGKLNYSTNGVTSDNATWIQDNDRVEISINNGFSTYKGTISNDTMTGTAENLSGLKWSWELEKQ